MPFLIALLVDFFYWPLNLKKNVISQLVKKFHSFLLFFQNCKQYREANTRNQIFFDTECMCPVLQGKGKYKLRRFLRVFGLFHLLSSTSYR